MPKNIEKQGLDMSRKAQPKPTEESPETITENPQPKPISLDELMDSVIPATKEAKGGTHYLPFTDSTITIKDLTTGQSVEINASKEGWQFVSLFLKESSPREMVAKLIGLAYNYHKHKQTS